MDEQTTGTLEQAILARVAQVADESLQGSGGFLGRSAMQKIVYFLQACGVPIRYRFNVHHYGPFCSAILDDVDSLIINDVLVDKSSNPERHSNYHPGETAPELIEQYQERLNEYDDLIKAVVKVLVPLKPERLELISTLHYVYRELSASGEKPIKEKVLARFKDFKGDKFDDKLSETFDLLQGAGVFK